MIKAGLIGSPIRRSLSPRLFGIFSSLLGETFFYSLLETGKPEGLETVLARIKAMGWRGFNVTLPLKEAVVPLLDALSPEAGAIGAVNAVTVKHGRLKGYNTDAFAVGLALREAGCRPRGRVCTVWGAGGAARAAVWVLARAGAAAVSVRGRSPERVKALLRVFSRLFPRVRFTAAAVPGATIFVNATPLGMYAPMPPALRVGGPPGSFYLDFAYPPLKRTSKRSISPITPFLEGRRGKTIPGLDLLIYQALKSAELFGAPDIPTSRFLKLKIKITAELYGPKGPDANGSLDS